jgi:peroxiredoxin
VFAPRLRPRNHRIPSGYDCNRHDAIAQFSLTAAAGGNYPRLFESETDMRYPSTVAFWIAYCGLAFAGLQSRADEEAKSATPPTETKSPAASTNSAGLPEGWKKDIEIPEWRDVKTGHVFQAASNLKLWVEQGWLVARYERPERGLEWQIVLAPATNSNPPEVRLDKQPPGFELNYGKYFIREHIGWLSILRERKTKETPAWPRIPIPNTAKASWVSREVGNWEDNSWRWFGLRFDNDATFENAAAQRYDIWLRVQHVDLPSETGSERNGVESIPFTMDVYYHDFSFHDEGDVFFGRRSTDTEEQVRTKLANILNRRPAPELTVKQWLNTPPETSLKKLQGKAVLLYFWNGTDYSAFATRLERKYKDRGLVVLGIHPNQDSEKLDELFKEKNIDLPNAIDTARLDIQRAYTVKLWPTYFLIDKGGKVSQGYLEHPPTDKQVEALLQ